jgi:hypothetical protein
MAASSRYTVFASKVAIVARAMARMQAIARVVSGNRSRGDTVRRMGIANVASRA